MLFTQSKGDRLLQLFATESLVCLYGFCRNCWNNPSIPRQAGITEERGQSTWLHSSGGYWSIAQRWKAKLKPVILLRAPACTGPHFTSLVVCCTPSLHSWIHILMPVSFLSFCNSHHKQVLSNQYILIIHSLNASSLRLSLWKPNLNALISFILSLCWLLLLI